MKKIANADMVGQQGINLIVRILPKAITVLPRNRSPFSRSRSANRSEATLVF